MSGGGHSIICLAAFPPMPPASLPSRRVTCTVAGLAFVLVASSSLLAQGASRTRATRDVRIADSLLALMTLDEKLGQLTQSPAGYGQTGPTVDAAGEADVRAGRVGSFLSLYGA